MRVGFRERRSGSVPSQTILGGTMPKRKRTKRTTVKDLRSILRLPPVVACRETGPSQAARMRPRVKVCASPTAARQRRGQLRSGRQSLECSCAGAQPHSASPRSQFAVERGDSLVERLPPPENILDKKARPKRSGGGIASKPRSRNCPTVGAARAIAPSSGKGESSYWSFGVRGLLTLPHFAP